jgi:hypothetical protein
VRVVGNRVVIAGPGPRAADGSYVGPSGKVGGDFTVEQGCHAAKLTALAILGDLKRELRLPAMNALYVPVARSPRRWSP